MYMYCIKDLDRFHCFHKDNPVSFEFSRLAAFRLITHRSLECIVNAFCIRKSTRSFNNPFTACMSVDLCVCVCTCMFVCVCVVNLNGLI